MSAYLIQRLSFGGILDQSFRLLRKHFVALTGAFVVLYVPYNVGVDLLGVSDPANFAKPSQIVTFGIVMLALLALAPWAQLAATAAIADAYLSRPTSFRSSLSRASKLYLPYLGTSLLIGLALIPLSLLLLVPGIYFMICWVLVGPICVIEDTFGSKAMARSRALVRGHFWRTFGLVIVSGVIGAAVGGALEFAFEFIPLLGPALTGVVQGVTSSYTSAVIVVAYVDLRCRHENFDIELLAREVAGSGATQAAPIRAPDAASA